VLTAGLPLAGYLLRPRQPVHEPATP